MTSIPNVNVDFDFGAEQRRMRRSPDPSVAPAIINGKYEYDPTVWNNATEAVRAKMESPADYRTRLEAEAYIERLKKTQFPDQYRQQQAELQQLADANEYITQLKLDAEGRDSFMANVQDLGTSIWDFLGVQAPSLAMRMVASPDDVEFQEAIDELQSGEIYRSSFVETARNVLGGVGIGGGMTGGSGITRTPEELANRFNNPEGWGRTVGQAAGSALLSAAAIIEPTPFGEIAVLGAFGVMGVGSGFEKYDEIVRKNNIDSATRDRILVGLGYAAAEVGAEYIGLGIAKSGAKRLGIAMASKTARAVGAEVIEKGVAAGVKRWGSSIGVSLFTGGISEGMEEALTQVAQNHIDILADPGQNWSRADALEGTVDAFVMGAVAGGMVVGPAIYSKSRTEAKKYAALGEALLEDRDVAIAKQAEAVAEEAEADVVEQQPEVQPSAIVVKDADGEVREAYPYDETDELSLEAAETQADGLLQQLGPAGQNWTTEKATPEQYAEITGATAVAEETAQVVEEAVPEQAETPVVDQPVAEEPVVELDPVQQQQQQDRRAEVQIDTAVREARGLDPLAEGEQPMVRIIPEEEETNQPKILTKLREVAAKTSEGTGVPLRIVQVDTQAGEQAAPFDGLYYGNTIYVDANRVREGETAGSDKVFTRILAHELLHATKDVNPELYEHMVKRLGKKKLGRMAVKYAERLSNGEYARMNPEAQIEEALAQAFESDLAAIANGTFSGDRTLAGKIVDFVRQTADRLGLRGGFKKDLDSIVRQLAEGKSLQDLKLASMKPGKPQAQAQAQAETRPETTDQAGPMLSPAPPVQSPEFRRWFKNSEIVNEQGEPQLAFHGTKQEFTEFRPRFDDGLMFFTLDSQFASDWMRGVGGLRQPSDEVISQAEEMRVYERQLFDEMGIRDIDPSTDAGLAAYDQMRQSIRDRMVERFGFESASEYEDVGGTRVMPVYLSVQKLFDPRKHWNLIDLKSNSKQFTEAAKRGNWSVYEDKDTVDQIKALGFDGMLLSESALEGSPLNTVAIFDPTQVKSATANVGTYDPSDPDIRMSPAEDYGFADVEPLPVKTLTSKLQPALDVVDNRVWGKEELKKHLKQKHSVKDDELEWSGFNEYLEGVEGERVSLDDVREAVNEVELTEYTLGGPFLVDMSMGDPIDISEEAGMPMEETTITAHIPSVLDEYGMPQEFQYVFGVDLMSNDAGVYRMEDRNAMSDLWIGAADDIEQAYEAIKRDVYDRMGVSAESIGQGDTSYEEMQLEGGEDYKELLLRWNPTEGEFLYPEHWMFENILLHVRHNTRYDENGNKILFLEEVQSDWHQQGRKNGYNKPVARPSDIPGAGELFMPDAPFKNSWKELAMKRMIAHAVANGFDGIAWTTGEQQAERSRKQITDNVSQIVVKSQGKGRYRLEGYGTTLYEKDNLTDNQLADIVGVDLAKDAVEKIAAGEYQVSYDTKDITIGATGHRMFYDPPVETIDPDTGKKKKSGGILWNATTKVTKKYGVKPELLQIEGLGSQPGFMLGEQLTESVSENMQLMFSPAPLTEYVMPKSLEEIAGDNTSMWGSLFMIRDKLTDFSKWRMSMLERYPDMTREELYNSFTEAVLLSNYITDVTNNKLVLKRHAKEELADIESLKRRFRYATGTERMIDEFRTGVKVGAAKEISRFTEKLERLKESVRSKRESISANQKLFNEIIREAGMSSGKLDKIIANADVRRRQFETEEQLQAAIDASLKAIDSFYRKEAQKSLRRTMKQISKAKFRPEFDSRVAKLLDDAGLTEKMYTKTERARLGSVLAFIDSMTNEELEELALPQSVRNQAEAFRGSKKDISELNAEEAIALRDALRAVIHLNRLKNKLIRVGKERDYARTASAIRVELERATAQVPLLGRSEEMANQENIAVRQIRNFYNSVNLLTPDRFAIWWSGGRDTEFYQRAYVDIADGKREMLRQYQQDQDYLREGLKQVGVDPDTQEGSELLRSMSYDMNNRITRLRALVRAVTGKGKIKDAVPFMKSRGLATEPNLLDIELESGRVLQLTRAERIDLLCHFSDLDTRASIENGSPIEVGRQTNKKVYTLTAADIRNIEQYYDNLGEVDVERQISEILLSRYNGAMRVAVQGYSVDHLGYDITKESTYYPRSRVRRDKDGKEEILKPTPGNYVEKTLDNLSITKDRKANNQAIRVRDALTVYNNHSYMVAGLSHMSAPIRNLNRLMSDQSLTDFLETRKGGSKVITYYNNLLEDLVKEVNGGMSRGSLDDRYSSGKLLTSIARSVTVGSLGFNPRVMLYQTASLIAASSEMPARYVAMGARSLADRDLTKEIEMYSPNLRERFASSGHGLVSEGLSDSPNNPLVQERKFADLVMSGISKFDEFAIRSIWSGSKQWVSDDIKNGILNMEVGSQEYWAEVTRRADDVVHKTQPTMDFLHLSGFARRARSRGTADRLLNMFSSQRHKNINMQADALIKMRNGDATGALRGAIAHTILQPLLLWGIRGTYGLFLGSGVTSLWSMAFGSGKMEPEWEEEEDKNEMWLLGGIVDNVISTNFGNLPLGDYVGVPLRKGVNYLIGYEADYYDPSMSPVYGVVEGAAKSSNYLVDKILAEDKSPDLNDYLFTATRVGQLFGVPTHAVNEIRKVYNDSQSSGAIDVIRRRRSELLRMRNKSDDKSLPERFEKELNLINRYYNNYKLPSGKTGKGINSFLRVAKEQEELAKKHEGTPRGERHKKAMQRALVKANERAKKLYEAVESRNERDDRGR